MKPEQRAALDRLQRAIETATLNLMSRAERERVGLHVDEAGSLAARVGPEVRRVVDVGSGGGLPALPMAILLEQTRWSLVESVGRKARFLAETAATLDLSGRVDVHCVRSEEAARGPLRAAADLAIARALAAPVVALELLAPFVRVGGEAWYLSTATAAAGAGGDSANGALARACEELGMGPPRLEPHATELRGDGVIIRARRERPVPERFPRRVGLARAHPLA